MRVWSVVPVVLVATLAACGGSSAPPAPVGGDGASTSGGASASSTSAGNGAGGAASVKPSVVSGASPGDETGSRPVAAGTIDAAELTTNLHNAMVHKRTFKERIVEPASTATGTVDYGGGRTEDLRMSLTIVEGKQKILVVYVGGVAYMDMGKKVNGKTWISSEGTDTASQQLANLAKQLQAQASLGGAPSAFKSVKAVGKAGPTLDGVPTVVFTMKLTSKQLVAELPSGAPASAAAELAGKTAVRTISVGKDWLPRKVVEAVTAKGKTVTTTSTFSGWGTRVTVAAPPAADVNGPAPA